MTSTQAPLDLQEHFEKNWAVNRCKTHAADVDCPVDSDEFLAAGAVIKISLANYPNNVLQLITAASNPMQISDVEIKAHEIREVLDSNGQSHHVPFLQIDFLDASRTKKRLELHLIRGGNVTPSACQPLLDKLAGEEGLIRCDSSDPAKPLVHWRISTLSSSTGAGSGQVIIKTPPDDSQGTGTG